MNWEKLFKEVLTYLGARDSVALRWNDEFRMNRAGDIMVSRGDELVYCIYSSEVPLITNWNVTYQ